MTTFDPLEGLIDAALEAPDAPTTPRRAGIKAIAEATHSSNAAAAAILRAAGMRRDANKTYLFDKAVNVVMASKDPARSVGHVAGGDDSALDDRAVGTISALSNAKAHYETLRSRKLEQDIAVRAGKLLPRDDIIAAAKEFATITRTNVLAVAAKTAANLAGKSAEDIQRLLTEALREALTAVADDGLFLLPSAKT